MKSQKTSHVFMKTINTQRNPYKTKALVGPTEKTAKNPGKIHLTQSIHHPNRFSRASISPSPSSSSSFSISSSLVPSMFLAGSRFTTRGRCPIYTISPREQLHDPAARMYYAWCFLFNLNLIARATRSLAASLSVLLRLWVTSLPILTTTFEQPGRYFPSSSDQQPNCLTVHPIPHLARNKRRGRSGAYLSASHRGRVPRVNVASSVRSPRMQRHGAR